MQNYTEIVIGRCSISLGISENLGLAGWTSLVSQPHPQLLLFPVSLLTIYIIPVMLLKRVVSKCSACLSIFDNLWKTSIYPLELHVSQSPCWTYLALPFIALHDHFRLNSWLLVHVVSTAVSGVLEDIKVIVILVSFSDLLTPIVKNQTLLVSWKKNPPTPPSFLVTSRGIQ